MATEYGREFEFLPTLEPIRHRLLEMGASRGRGNDPAEIDLSWLDDPNAMRSRSPAEAETTRLLNTYAAGIIRLYDEHPARAELETARVLNLYAAEIIRLNEYFPAEIARLNEVYPAEISRYQAEIGRLHSVYQTEIVKLRQIVESYWSVRIYRLCKSGGARILRTLQKAGPTRS